MKCPNCRAADISPLTHRCELCGFVPEGLVVVEAPKAEALEDLARHELGERFALDTFLGRGPASVVFLAREHGSDRQIVVKVLARPVDGREGTDERLRGAVLALTELEHPHIVPVFDHGATEHLYWYSMQHVRGRSLRNLLLSRGPLDLKACLRLVAQVASALDHVHRRGMLHGDLKPENVLIDAEGWAHVGDFLVSRALEPPLRPRPSRPSQPDADGARADRSPYAAPEVLRTPSSDQYALAMLVYECLVGSPPFDSDEVGLAPTSLLSATRPDIPAHVTRAMDRALSPRPIDRFPGVLDFVAALESTALSTLDARPSVRTSASVLRVDGWKPPERPWRRRAIIGGSILAAIVAGLLLRPVIAGLLGAGRQEELSTLDLPPADTAPAPAPAADTTALAPAAGGRSAAGPAGRAGTTAPGTSRAQAPASSAAGTPRPRRSEQPARAAAEPAPPAAPAPAAAPADSGRVFVNATPWGQVFIDGRSVGNTPKANLAVPAGSHVIRVVREGFEPFERTVQVGAGQVVRLTDIVLAERNP